MGKDSWDVLEKQLLKDATISKIVSDKKTQFLSANMQHMENNEITYYNDNFPTDELKEVLIKNIPLEIKALKKAKKPMTDEEAKALGLRLSDKLDIKIIGWVKANEDDLGIELA